MATAARRVAAACGLGGGERAGVGGGVERGIGGVAGGGFAEEHALGFEAGEDGGGDAGEAGEFLRREAGVAELGEGGEDAGPGGGEAVGPGAGEAEERARGGGLAEAGGAGGEAEHGGEGGEGIVGGAGEEFAHRGGERRDVEDAGDGAEPGGLEVAPGLAPDQAEDAAGAERDLDEVAGAGAAFRRAVVEDAVEALGGDDGDRLARREMTRRRGRIEVFHRAIPWANIPRDHKG